MSKSTQDKKYYNNLYCCESKLINSKNLKLIINFKFRIFFKMHLRYNYAFEQAKKDVLIDRLSIDNTDYEIKQTEYHPINSRLNIMLRNNPYGSIYKIPDKIINMNFWMRSEQYYNYIVTYIEIYHDGCGKGCPYDHLVKNLIDKFLLLNKFISLKKFCIRMYIKNLSILNLLKNNSNKISYVTGLPKDIINIIISFMEDDLINSDIYKRYLIFIKEIESTYNVSFVDIIKYDDLTFLNHYKNYIELLTNYKDNLSKDIAIAYEDSLRKFKITPYLKSNYNYNNQSKMYKNPQVKNNKFYKLSFR